MSLVNLGVLHPVKQWFTIITKIRTEFYFVQCYLQQKILHCVSYEKLCSVTVPCLFVIGEQESDPCAIMSVMVLMCEKIEGSMEFSLTIYHISGSSSKLGHLPAYHHCTLLCNVDTHTLNDLLSPTYVSIAYCTHAHSLVVVIYRRSWPKICWTLADYNAMWWKLFLHKRQSPSVHTSWPGL